MVVHDNFKMIRDAWRFSKQEMADLLGITYTMWSNYESGKTAPPIDILEKIEDFTGITMKQLRRVELTKSMLSTQPLTDEMKEQIALIRPLSSSEDEKQGFTDRENLPLIERVRLIERFLFGS